MKTVQEIDLAREAICLPLANPEISGDQKKVLMGMLVALRWVEGVGGSTLQKLIDGEPVAAGRTFKDVPPMPNEMITGLRD
jgi:hypothetical protein